MFGAEILTAYGWGIISKKCDLPNVMVKLDWNGVLYANLDAHPFVRSSKCDIGQSVLTPTGTHLVLTFNRDSDSYDTICFSPSISEHRLNANEITKLIPNCSGLPVVVPDVGKGVITNYNSGDDKFEIKLESSAIWLPSCANLTFQYRRVYPICWYIIKNYLSGHKISSETISSIDNYTASINSQVDSNQYNSAIAQIKHHLGGMQKLLVSCSERIVLLQSNEESATGLNATQLKVCSECFVYCNRVCLCELNIMLGNGGIAGEYVDRCKWYGERFNCR